MINEALPEDIRDYSRVIDKKGLNSILQKLADKGDSELYRTTLHKLWTLGGILAHTNGTSFSIEDLRTPPKTKRMMDGLRAKVTELAESDMPDDKKEKLIQDITIKSTPIIEETMMQEMLAAGNPFALQVLSGSRGDAAALRSLVAGDMLVRDHRDRALSVPILNGYGQGLSPAEYWAGSYSARKGAIATKLMVQKAGFLGKQLVQAAHRQVVTSPDCETSRGIPVAGSDEDNIGTVLAQGVNGIPAGTIITPNIAAKLRNQKTIYVRSPLTCEAHDGVCSRCAGVRERGELPAVGDNVGIAAAQSLTERLSQGTLNVKHSTSKAKASDDRTGFDLINQLVQVPSSFRGGATVATVDGTVTAIDTAPQGGHYVTVGGVKHRVKEGLTPTVKLNTRVEAGDVLSEGLPNPYDIVQYKGLGAGRLAFVDIFRNAYKKSSMPANRRNIELLTRGLINHVRMTSTDGVENALPDDIMEYTSIERNYKPRYGFRSHSPAAAIGKYLEQPVNQYTIGTRITPRVAEDLASAKIKSVMTHDDPPPFAPEMLRAMEHLTYDPDWQVRLGGSYLQKGLLEAVHRGRKSQLHSTSYIPALARGKDFGETLSETGVY